jgi:hypothetical protein
MVSGYKKKKPPQNRAGIQECLDAMTSDGSLSIRGAALHFGFPEATVRRHWHAVKNASSVPTVGNQNSLPSKTEAELSVLIKSAAVHGFGFSRQDVKEFVGSFVRANWDKEDELGMHLRQFCRFGPSKVPSDDWMRHFAERHNLSLKKAGALERVRKLSD